MKLTCSSSTKRYSTNWKVIITFYYSFSLLNKANGFSAIDFSGNKKVTFLQASTLSISEQFLDTIRKDHEHEINYGVSNFSNDGNSNAPRKQWLEKDFKSYSLLEKGIAGPDEYVLNGRGHEIFESVEPVVTKEECEFLIGEARNMISKDLNDKEESSGDELTNSQLGEARVSQLPKARDWLRQALHERFFPILESRYGIPAKDLTLQDSLIIGYGYFGERAESQPIHRDSSILSLNVALSTKDSFEGGGTFFEGLPKSNPVITTDQGHVLCHSSGAPHAGRGISGGQRWVLVLFCLAKEHVQISRRCHARGMIERDMGRLEEAERYFKMGLSVTPTDHLLLSSLGSLYMERERDGIFQAQCLLSKAALAYPHCPKANMALSRMMLESRQPRAALRRFSTVLELLDNQDLQPDALVPLKSAGWSARVYGGHAAILCFLGAKNLGIEMDSATLFKARNDLEIALMALPDDDWIKEMINKIDELLIDFSTEN